MSAVVEPIVTRPSFRLLRWTALASHTGMKTTYAVGRIERGRHESGPGSLHVRHPGDMHRDVGRAGPVTFTVASFAPALVDDAIGPVRLEPMLGADDERGAALHRLLDATGDDGLTLDVLLAEALASLGALDGPCRHTRAVRRALAMLRERITETIALDELAAHAGLDRYRLCRAFRAEVGLPPHAYLLELRVLRAKELLAAGTAPRDVAPLAGFYDQSQLNRHFRRIVGTTPGRWAREA